MAQDRDATGVRRLSWLLSGEKKEGRKGGVSVRMLRYFSAPSVKELAFNMGTCNKSS